MNDQEINEACARKLGWTEITPTIYQHVLGHPPGFKQPKDLRIYPTHILPDYCHSIEAAWEIVEKCKDGQINLVYFHGKSFWKCWFYADRMEPRQVGAEADTAPRAICLTFLQLEEK